MEKTGSSQKEDASNKRVKAGQVMPPACIIAFVVCSLVGGILNKKVDPVKTMIYCTPMAIYFLVIGVAFFFI